MATVTLKPAVDGLLTIRSGWRVTIEFEPGESIGLFEQPAHPWNKGVRVSPWKGTNLKARVEWSDDIITKIPNWIESQGVKIDLLEIDLAAYQRYLRFRGENPKKLAG